MDIYIQLERLMPQLDNRQLLEEGLAQDFARELGVAEEDLWQYLGDEPSQLPPQSFWEKVQNRWREAFIGSVIAIFLAASEDTVEQVGIPVEEVDVIASASDWASQYSFDLVSGLTRTRQDLLQREMSKLLSEEITLAQFQETVGRAFSPVRAEMIAVTETTRAIAEADRLTVERIARDTGLRFREVWETHPELSQSGPCPICEPRDGLPVEPGWEIPAHVRCVCRIRREPIVEE